MKGKRINPLERHVEKLFFLLIVMALLAVLVKQFATGGMTVKVGSQSGLTIRQGYARIANDAERVDGKIKEETLDKRAPTTAPDVSGLIGPREHLVTSRIAFGIDDSGGALDIESSGIDGLREGVRYAMPRQPAPNQPLVQLGAGALDPIVVAQLPALAARAGDEQPYDMQFVTISAQFDAEALRQAFSADPDGDGSMQVVPRHWWKGMLVLLDVELWRQEMDSAGVAGDETLVGTMPGMVSMRDQYREGAEQNMQHVLDLAEQAADRITRPVFYPIIAGPVWTPPAPPIELSSMDREALSKRAQLDRLSQEIQDALDEYDAAKNQGNQRSRLPKGTTSIENLWAGGIGGGRGRGGNPKKDNRKSAEQRQREATARRLVGIQDKIDRFEDSRSEILAWFTEHEIDAASIMEEDPGVKLLEAPVGSLQESDTLTVWTHDIDAKPGVIYRYRVRLVYGNPFYGRENVIHEDLREELAQARIIRSGFSPWSEPVTTDRKNYMFLTRASADKGLGGAGVGVATAEMYSFYYGYWRQSKVRLRAGDPIVGLFDLPALNIFEIIPGKGENAQDNMQISEIPDRSSFERAMSSILLDVRRSARVQRDPLKGNREPGSVEAVILGPNKTIEIKNPALDRASDRRQRLLESVELGMTAVPVYPGTGGVAQAALEIKSNAPRSTDRGRENREDPSGIRDDGDSRLGR